MTVTMNRYSDIILTSENCMDANETYAATYQEVAHQDEESLGSLKQTYYFEYNLPNGVRAVSKGYDVIAHGQRYGITGKESIRGLGMKCNRLGQNCAI